MTGDRGPPREPIRPDRPPPAGEAPRAVYVHAPFCARRCFYCDFAVEVRKEGSPDEWLRALRGEWRAVRREGRFWPRAPLETLYVGGGTPSLLGPGAMQGLADLFGAELLGSPDLEWSAEANPESFTLELATAWRRAGVNRVSLGVQSFHEPALRWMGRLHGPEGAEEAVGRARSAGFSNVSIDLIFGLPERLERSWLDDLRRTLDLGVPHVSLYGLSVEPDTPLGRAVGRGRETVAEDSSYVEAYLLAAETFREAGYVHYEVSNFALPGYQCRHNGSYWDGSSYLGLGNSAHSYRHPIRRWNLRDWPAYSSATVEGTVPAADEESLSRATTRLERIWLGLRTHTGVHRPSLPKTARAVTDGWRESGLALCEDEAIRLTPRGWLALDRLTVELDEAWEDPVRGRPGVHSHSSVSASS